MRLDGETDELVWYVAFGSNLCADRLQEYLDRTSPVAPARDRVPVRLPHRLYFARRTNGRWKPGGTAFVDPARDPHAGTLGTAWLLRPDQFVGVVAGENGVDAVDVAVDELPTEPGGSVQVVERHYGLVLACDSPDGRRAFTVTTPEPQVPNRPVEPYVDRIVAGLVEGHGLTEAEARAYVDARRI